jgi:hypothetical protein
MANYIFKKDADAILTIPDVTQQNFLGVAAYMKPGAGLDILREHILGKNALIQLSGLCGKMGVQASDTMGLL